MATTDYEFIDHTFDVIVVGAGGSGLRATLGLAGAVLKPANITKVVTLIAKKQLIDDTTSSFLIRWISVTQLTVNMLYRLFTRVRCIFL